MTVSIFDQSVALRVAQGLLYRHGHVDVKLNLVHGPKKH